ncbi:MAG: hypothetical protein LBH82_07485 [Bacteroidales bacterium]|jgi:hypothetical protein|nr:hypothetical protein [Bacteroidales bacterium]
MTNEEIIDKYERGEYIDFELTEEEKKVPEFGRFKDFNREASARDLCSLYTYRHNFELGSYFVEKAEWYNRFPVDGKDCFAIEEYQKDA